MDVDPMAETVALYGDLVRNVAPIVTIADEPVTAVDVEAPVAIPFVGRAAPLRKLGEIWSRGVRGRGSLVLIGGEAGVGKTRLVEEIVARARAGGAVVLAGTTPPIEATPYQAVIEALGPATAGLRERGIEPVWLSTLEAFGHDRPGAQDAPPALDAAAERRRLFEAIAVALERLSETSPVLFVLEDMHAAGHATMALVEYVARRIAERPIVVLVTYREEELHRAHPLRALRRRLEDRQLASIPIGPLNAVEVDALTSAMTGTSNADLAARIFRSSDGNPLFAVELLRSAQAPGANFPPTLADAIAVRLERLDGAARTLIDFAAVIGRGFDIELMCQLCGWSEDEALGHLDDLIARHLVRETDDRRYGYHFSHQ
ncbi:MAG: ATP-binding protein, partial [Candidatus Dormibacteria bacterium]